MLVKIKLKNADESVIIDDYVFEHLSSDAYFAEVKFLDNLRKHSSGCVVFQKTWRKAEGSFKTETIYLHKLLAERFLGNERTPEKNLVGIKNGDRMDCRIENLMWQTRSYASRQRKTSNYLGYTGVYREGKRYRALINYEGKPLHLGMFDTPEQAALAYNAKSKELFGKEGKINKIKAV